MSKNSKAQSENEQNDGIESELNKSCLNNVNNIFVDHLNISSLPGKFDQLELLIINKIDILVLNETKLGGTFPSSRFLIDGSSKPFRLDRNQKGCGIFIFIGNDIPSKLLSKHNFPGDMEELFIELNFRKTKWLFLGTYHPISKGSIFL